MKNFLYTSLFFILYPVFTMAQLQPGSLFLSGRLSIAANNQNGGQVFSSSPLFTSGSDISATTVEIAPSLAYLFSGNLAAGLELSYENSSTKVEQLPSSSIFIPDQENSLRLFTVRPFVRYYKPFNEKLGFQLDIFGGLGFGQSTSGRLMNNTIVEVKEDLSSFELGLSPGLYYFISPRFMIDATIGGIGYESQKATVVEPGAGSRESNRFYTFLESGIGLSIGVNLFFLSAR
ncbi:MAG: outer membrane beta-barrel protein [Phaeodactylibacter sp.]|nr:outer membrane beta-barrel protein [Phaeodactylibacter sp.]